MLSMLSQSLSEQTPFCQAQQLADLSDQDESVGKYQNFQPIICLQVLNNKQCISNALPNLLSIDSPPDVKHVPLQYANHKCGSSIPNIGRMTIQQRNIPDQMAISKSLSMPKAYEKIQDNSLSHSFDDSGYVREERKVCRLQPFTQMQINNHSGIIKKAEQEEEGDILQAYLAKIEDLDDWSSEYSKCSNSEMEYGSKNRIENTEYIDVEDEQSFIELNNHDCQRSDKSANQQQLLCAYNYKLEIKNIQQPKRDYKTYYNQGVLLSNQYFQIDAQENDSRSELVQFDSKCKFPSSSISHNLAADTGRDSNSYQKLGKYDISRLKLSRLQQRLDPVMEGILEQLPNDLYCSDDSISEDGSSCQASDDEHSSDNSSSILLHFEGAEIGIQQEGGSKGGSGGKTLQQGCKGNIGLEQQPALHFAQAAKAWKEEYSYHQKYQHSRPQGQAKKNQRRQSVEIGNNNQSDQICSNQQPSKNRQTDGNKYQFSDAEFRADNFEDFYVFNSRSFAENDAFNEMAGDAIFQNAQSPLSTKGVRTIYKNDKLQAHKNAFQLYK
ncbi:hypothetical protein FGO68_gene8525 [Halteria grandinella]|uniref:Uncharacterized protein n=1 Tax=Halteria grandinella TaxID=5974 RepID=A0A8J8NQP9_HALGN|nr:hypothetical protein FGO68_gene8525 [Halteria grandinella]